MAERIPATIGEMSLQRAKWSYRTFHEHSNVRLRGRGHALREAWPDSFGFCLCFGLLRRTRPAPGCRRPAAGCAKRLRAMIRGEVEANNLQDRGEPCQDRSECRGGRGRRRHLASLVRDGCERRGWNRDGCAQAPSAISRHAGRAALFTTGRSSGAASSPAAASLA